MNIIKVIFHITLAIVISLVGLVIASLPARAAAMPGQADLDPCVTTSDYTLDVGQSICWPLQPNTTVVVQGPVYMWGLRNVAKYVDARVDRLRIISRVGVKCADYPWAFCLRVHKYRFNYAWQADGRMAEYRAGNDRYDGTATFGDIGLNTAYSKYWIMDRQYAAGHELLHALGMQHHSRDGYGPDHATRQGMLAESSMAPWPSRREIIALQYWFEFDNTN